MGGTYVAACEGKHYVTDAKSKSLVVLSCCMSCLRAGIRAGYRARDRVGKAKHCSCSSSIVQGVRKGADAIAEHMWGSEHTDE